MEIETATTPARVVDEPEEDESETEYDRFQRYITGTEVKRLVAVRNLVSTCKSIGYQDTVQFILPSLDIVVIDEDSTVKEVLAQQIAPLIEYISKNGNPPETAINSVLSLAFKLVKDKDAQVRTATEDAFIEIAPKLTKELVEAPILTSVLYMAHEDECEEQRITAMKLLGELAHVFGRELCTQFASPEAISLAGDPMFRVRKAAAQYIAKIARAAPYDFAVEKLLPIFKKLSKDEIWGVRKSCAEALWEMLEVFPDDADLVALIEIMINDSSRWVRTGGYTFLGRCINSLKPELVTKEIVSLYGSMTSPELAAPGENSILNHCAFNFPAVAMKIGPGRWGELQETYSDLVKDIQWNVRRTLAFSVHVMAQSLGPEVTRQSLVPAVNSFLKDLDEVKIGVIQNLAEFLSVLDEEDRKSFLDVLDELEMDSSNWRHRSILATQLAPLSKLYDDQVLRDHFHPMLVRLMQDPVSQVRINAGMQLGPFLDRLVSLDADWRSDVVEEIIDFATNLSYQQRIVFVVSCDSLIDFSSTHSLFTESFLPALVDLATDNVPNVRIRVAACLKRLPAELLTDAARDAVAGMGSDKDRDVKATLSGTVPSLETESGKVKTDTSGGSSASAAPAVKKSVAMAESSVSV